MDEIRNSKKEKNNQIDQIPSHELITNILVAENDAESADNSLKLEHEQNLSIIHELPETESNNVVHNSLEHPPVQQNLTKIQIPPGGIKTKNTKKPPRKKSTAARSQSKTSKNSSKAFNAENRFNRNFVKKVNNKN